MQIASVYFQKSVKQEKCVTSRVQVPDQFFLLLEELIIQVKLMKCEVSIPMMSHDFFHSENCSYQTRADCWLNQNQAQHDRAAAGYRYQLSVLTGNESESLIFPPTLSPHFNYFVVRFLLKVLLKCCVSIFLLFLDSQTVSYDSLTCQNMCIPA